MLRPPNILVSCIEEFHLALAALTLRKSHTALEVAGSFQKQLGLYVRVEYMREYVRAKSAC